MCSLQGDRGGRVPPLRSGVGCALNLVPTVNTKRAFYYAAAILIALVCLTIDLIRIAVHRYQHRHDELLRELQPVSVREIVSDFHQEAIAPVIAQLNSLIQPHIPAVMSYLEWVRTVILRYHYEAMDIRPSIVTDPDVSWN